MTRDFSTSSRVMAGSRKIQSSRTQLKRILRNNIALLLSFVFFLILTIVYFFAIRSHDVELSFNQLSAFERQVQTVGNHTIYIVDPSKHDDEILSTFSRQQWSKISNRIDYVAFIYDEIDAVIGTGTWIADVTSKFQKENPNGYGIVLFSCGCIIPNMLFTEIDVRLYGFECSLLPGFVIPEKYVRFFNVTLPTHRCVSRDVVLGRPWYDDNIDRLEIARKEHEALRRNLHIMEQKNALSISQ